MPSTLSTASPAPATARKQGAAFSAWYGLAILIVATLFSFVDREVLSLTAEPLRRSLGLSDTQLGLLQGVGMGFFAGVASLPVAWLADRFGRRSVLVAAVLIWSASAIGCGAARNFGELMLATACLGIGQAGLGPIVFGLIPDLFPPHQRILANTLYSLVATLGAALGLTVGGPLVTHVDEIRHFFPVALQALEGWRLSFFVVGLPGPLMALLILTMRMRRGAHVEAAQAAGAGAAGGEPPMNAITYVRTQLRAVIGLFGSVGLVGFGFGAIGTWSPIIAARTFGATPTEVGHGLAAAMAFGTLVGAVLVTPAARWMGPRVGLATPLRVIEFGLMVAVPLCVLLPFVASTGQMFTLIGVQVAAVTIGSLLFSTAMQDVSPPYLRSQVLAIGTIVTLVFSTSSPVIVGMLSDALHDSPRGLLIAVSIVATTGLGLGGLLMRWAEQPFASAVRRFTAEPSVGGQP